MLYFASGQAPRESVGEVCMDTDVCSEEPGTLTKSDWDELQRQIRFLMEENAALKAELAEARPLNKRIIGRALSLYRSVEYLID